eukprot:Clim_evm2s172 gene=Clim_evmTU2s172
MLSYGINRPSGKFKCPLIVAFALGLATGFWYGSIRSGTGDLYHEDPTLADTFRSPPGDTNGDGEDFFEGPWSRVVTEGEQSKRDHQPPESWLDNDIRAEFMVAATAPLEVKLAFFLQVSKAQMDSVPDLLNQIYDEKSVYCLHFTSDILDAEREELRIQFYRLRPHAQQEHNIHILPSLPTTYLGATITQNYIDGMRLLRDVDKTWTHFMNLSAADRPLVTNDVMRAFLDSAAQIEFIAYSRVSMNEKLAPHRYDHVWFDPSFYTLTTQGQREPLGWDPGYDLKPSFPTYKGSAWITVTREFVNFILDSRISHRVIAMMSTWLVSDEHFFQTMAILGGWHHRLITWDLRCIFWPKTGPKGHPLWIDAPEHVERLKHCHGFFARKFKHDSPILSDIKPDRIHHGESIDDQVMAIWKHVKATNPGGKKPEEITKLSARLCKQRIDSIYAKRKMSAKY